ncbi:MAG: FMN-binding protein [Deltaproteobacteria bacterium]|nr:FMN-binding protein [Deltaproteobacteria bacterium]
MSKHLKPIIFAAVLSIVCSSLLTLASTGLKKYQLKNIALDRQKNILKSVGLVDEKNAPSLDTIDTLYAENIRQMWVDFDGKLLPEREKGENDLPVYLHVRDGEIASFILPVDSGGLWGRILGYLALKNDGATVSGFTVYSHSETPGLGGEVEKSWFQNNFSGKKILDSKGNLVSVTVAKGKVKERIAKERQPNFVDGISGATLTGKFLSGGLKETLTAYEPLSERFRKKDVNTTEK